MFTVHQGRIATWMIDMTQVTSNLMFARLFLGQQIKVNNEQEG